MCVYQDRYLCCMLDGTGEGEIVEIFDMFDLKSLRTIFLDSKEMRVLSCAQVAGSIEIIDHLLYWSIPSELSFSVLDLNDIDGDITKYDIKDNDFFIEQFRSNNGSAHGKNILEYINSNSRILQLCCRKNTINLVAEVGTIEQDWNNKIVDYSKRFVKIYQVSNSGILKKTYRFKIYENYGLVKLCDDGLYVLKAEYNKDDFIIMLDKYSL